MLRFILLGLLVISVAGCTSLFGRNGYFTKQSTEYLSAREAPPVRLPANLNNAALSDDYYIPPVTGNPPSEPVSKLPPGSLIAGIEQGTIPKSVLKQKTQVKETPSLSAVNREPDLAPNSPFQRNGLDSSLPQQ